jgi:hypothetical protein
VAAVHPVVVQLTQPQLVALVVDLQTTEMALQLEQLGRVTLGLLHISLLDLRFCLVVAVAVLSQQLSQSPQVLVVPEALAR